MKHQNSRREFLKRAALLPLGVAVANVWPQSARAAGDSTLKRNPGPKLKLSLNAWSYYVQLHQHLKGQGGGMSLFDLLEECARLDFNAVDPTGYFFPGYPSVPEKKFLNEFKRRAFQLGLDISGTGIRNDFAVPDMTKRAADVTRNVLRTKILAGMLDGQPKVPETMRDCPEHRALVYESGLKSIVLLKNQHAILPLNPKLKSVALIGPNAATLPLDGHSSSAVIPSYTITPKQGLETLLGAERVLYAKGCDINSTNRSLFAEAKRMAKNSEVVVFVGGLDNAVEGEGYFIKGDRLTGSVDLPGVQNELINELAAASTLRVEFRVNGRLVASGGGSQAGGPLFFTHYSFLGFDPRSWRDPYCNYFENNRAISRIHHAYAVANPGHHTGYGENVWGLTVSRGPDGYKAFEPRNDNGTVAPTAALSAMPYTPRESMAALKHYYHALGNRLWGDFGFKDAFNLDRDWFERGYLAIDQGPIVVMIENHCTGLCWQLFMANEEIPRALGTSGWTKDWTDYAGYASMMPAEIGGVRQYIQLTGETLAGVAAADGRLLWRVPRIGKEAPVPTPIVADGYVYVTSADGMLYIRSSGSGTMVLIEATPKGWTEKGRFEQPDRSKIKADTPPVIADGILYLRDQDILLAYDVKRR